MANKQDLNGVRSAQDLERKYDLASLLGLKKNIKTQMENLIKINNELNGFIEATTRTLTTMGEQIDGKISTWYYEGQPTLNNLPAKDWTETEKEEHIGDIYYDKLTGYCYVFECSSNIYSWIRIKDTDITTAMSTAAAAQDTADNKRQIFVVQPTTPYSCGDLWISSNEIFICQVERLSGNFNSNDWINNLKYTDNTYASAIVDELGGERTTILNGTVIEKTAKWVKFTDLETGGSTIINGSNIKTGHIDTDVVSIGNGNVDIDEEGIKLNNGAKIVGEYGLYTNLCFSSFGFSENFGDKKNAGEYNLLGFGYDYATGADKYNIFIDVLIPDNFRIEEAYIVLRHIPHLVNMSDRSVVYGYSQNIKCYIGDVDGRICVPGYEDSEYYPDLNGISYSEITQCFNNANNSFTPVAPTSNNYYVEEVVSKNIASQIDNKCRIKIQSTNSTPSTKRACFEQTGFVFAQLNVYGYMSFE